MSPFPWRKYSKKELFDEYYKLKNKLHETDVDLKHLKSSRAGLKCSNYFFQYERVKTPTHGNHKSCFDIWNEDEKKIKDYVKKNDLQYDLFTAVCFLKNPSSQFPIFVAGQIYKYFNAKNSLDPYCGWGDRCLVAMSLDINYTGIDSNLNLQKHYDKMINYYPTESDIEIIYDKCENVDLDNVDFDFVFTSPPYWNKNDKITEKYNNCEVDYNNFLNNSLIPIIKKCLRKRVWVCINVPENMYDDLKKRIRKCDKIIKFGTKQNSKSKSHDHGKFKSNTLYCWKY